MSLVLLIVGLAIIIVFPAMQSLRDGTQRSATTANMNSVLRASAAYVQANGCLPCPTPPSTTSNGFGHVRGDISGAACGTCSVAEGLVPYASLGLPATVAKDGWGRWLTLRIDPDLAINFGVVPPTLPCTAGDPPPCTVGTSQKGLCRAALPTANRVLIRFPGSSATQYAALLILSHGRNGFGAYQTSAMAPAPDNAHPLYGGPNTSCTAGGGFERCNLNSDATFEAADHTENPADPFDDLLLYMGRNALVSLLGNGACQTSWEQP